jgi:uncharacterized repeat protein (TIGR01451 family)
VAQLAPAGNLPGAQGLNLAISLPLRNEQELDALLQQLYDPASPNYRRYLTPEQFTQRFGPTEQDYQALMDFAKSNGLAVTTMHPNRVVLDVEGAVTDIQKAFHLTLRVYRHPREAREFYAPDGEPSVDFGVPILHISGLDNYALPHPNLHERPAGLAANATPHTGSGPGGTYQGRDFRTAYLPGSLLNGTGQSVGLLEFDGFYGGDITNYESQTRLPNVPLTVVPINGGVGTPGSGVTEVSLDIEMVISMAPGVSRIYVYEAPNPSPWIDLLSRMANDNLSKQLSCSWGNGSADAAAEQIFKQMGAQGQSFFNATGDSDAFTGAVEFPSDSPNITQVGGTTLTTGTRAAYQSETVWNWGLYNGSYSGSSGGISTFYTIPSYQRGISMSANQGSTTMRNIPDVALTADNVYVVSGNGSTTTVGGTSAAAPLWAGFTALINQRAAAVGQAPVGFLNPALYNIGRGVGYAAAFHDITTGNNFSGGSPTRFAAVAGYDLCTGWGTPNGTNLIYALAGPPNLTPIIVSNSFILVAEGCTNGVVDPAETVTVNFGLANTGNANTTNLVATLLPTGGILFPSGPQTYGVLSTNGTAVAQPFTFTAIGICGGTNTASLQLQDGTANLGTVTFSFLLGQPSVTTVFSENFDGVTAPALPAGWTTSSSGAESNWVTVASQSDTAPNSAFSPDSSSVGVNELDSPAITLPAGAAQLAFRQNFNLETSYDGGVLEISIGGGAWTDILAAGGSFVSGGYNYTLSSSYNNPLSGRQAWSGISGGFITTAVNLPSAASGQTIQLRWRCGSDDSVGAPGWYVDTISITSSGYACCAQSTDLGVTLTASPDPVLVGQTLSYTLAVTNLGPASASSVTITDTLPASVTFVSASPGCVILGGEVVCNLGTLASGGTSNFTVVVAPTAEGLITNTLTVASPTADPNPANNTATNVITVGAPPAIIVQPGSQAVFPGAKVRFQVTAAGADPLSYQWSHNGTNLPGAVDTVLSLINVGMAQAGSYAVLVTDIFGSTLSSNAVLTVLDPWIVGQPQDQSVLAGATASFTVNGTGTTPLSYQWLKEGIPLADGGKISGSTTASLVLSNVQAGEMAAYSVVVSNSYGSVVSSNALLAVWPLLGWGRDDYGQADIPGGLTNVTGIAAGFSHSLALRVDGTVIAWGAGASKTGVLPNYGQSLVPDGLTNVTGIAAGFDHSLALRADGTVAAWGAGTTNTGANPHYGQALVPPGLSNVVAVAAGAYHSLALKSDGTAVAWGNNDFGQTDVPGGLTNVAAVAAGAYHSLALKSDGTVVAWGCNIFGQTDVPGGLTNMAAVAGGFGHSLALQADGIVVAWGNDSAGQTNVPGGLTNAVAVAGGFAHSLALRSDGTVVAWGSSSYGQTNVPPGLTNAVAIAGGSYQNLVLESDGRPALTVQPASQVATAGVTVQLLAMAAGLQPLSFQWQWNGTNIANATNATLTLTNVQSAQAGGYVVVVTNVAGSVTSVVASITVSSPEILLQISLAGPQVSISFASQPWLNYVLEYKHRLDDPAWTPLPWAVLGTGGLITLQDTNTSADSRYYRLRRE